MIDRTWSWASSAADLEERRRHAEQVVGQRLRRVRYFVIDYFREERAPGLSGHRIVVDDAEWMSPTWACEGFDSVDFGVELEMVNGEVFSVTWDPPGRTEGIGIRLRPLTGSALLEGADVAIWSVEDRSRWSKVMGRPIAGIELDYRDWGQPEGFWCPSMRLSFTEHTVVMVLGDQDRAGALAPSADNVAVLFDPVTAELPQFASNW
ncbi:MAG TPA: hypothetical protein VFN21_05160 [Acidimicrobiales bacterium]|nr:hypothetical protein [Acidimicrobiales bacterium]